MNVRGILVCLFFLGVFSISALPKRGRRILTTTPISLIAECTHSNDCNSDECCVIGPNRYSIPQCKKLREKDDSCRPIIRTLNVTLGYPDGRQIDLEEVHYIFCPCGQGLTCNISDEVCSGVNENNNQVIN